MESNAIILLTRHVQPEQFRHVADLIETLNRLTQEFVLSNEECPNIEFIGPTKTPTIWALDYHAEHGFQLKLRRSVSYTVLRTKQYGIDSATGKTLIEGYEQEITLTERTQTGGTLAKITATDLRDLFTVDFVNRSVAEFVLSDDSEWHRWKSEIDVFT